MILGLQFIAVVFALMMIYFAYLHYRRGELNVMEITSWFVIWGITISIVIFPSPVEKFARAFAISRVFDMMVVGGFILIIAMSYKVYIRTKNLEKKLEEYVRLEALKTKSKNS